VNRSCPASLRVSTALLAGAALALSAAAPASAGDNKRLLMHYMPWFESPDVRGFWGNHWTELPERA
jgi:Spy/CpxP family protein refolding chaperone